MQRLFPWGFDQSWLGTYGRVEEIVPDLVKVHHFNESKCLHGVNEKKSERRKTNKNEFNWTSAVKIYKKHNADKEKKKFMLFRLSKIFSFYEIKQK